MCTPAACTSWAETRALVIDTEVIETPAMGIPPGERVG